MKLWKTLLALGSVCAIACGGKSQDQTTADPEPPVEETLNSDGNGRNTDAGSGSTDDAGTDRNGTTSAGSDGNGMTGAGSDGESMASGGSGGSSVASDGAGGNEPGTTGVVPSIGTTGWAGGDGCLWAGSCPCTETSSPVPLDEITPLGFSAQQVLDFAAGPHEATLTYDEDNFSGFTLSLPDQPTTLTLAIEPTGTASFITDAVVQGSAICATVLGLDVEVTLSTADGAFNERFSDRLLVEDAERAHLMRTIDLESLEGNLSLGLPDIAYLPSVPELYVVIGKDFVVGDITGSVGSCTDDSCGLGSVRFAAWNDDCKYRRLPIQGTEAEPIISRIIDQVAAAPLAITWGSGDISDLSLEASSSNASVCHTPPGVLTYESRHTYLLETELSLSSEDGRLDTTLPVSMEITDTPEGEPVLAFLDDFNNAVPVEASTFEETYGLKDVDFTGAHEGYLDFFLRLEYGAGPTSPSSTIGGLDVRDGETVIEPIVIGPRE